LGFVGMVEYRHVYSQTGGAQYGRGSTVQQEVLTVYAEAFERDEDPEDFSLEAIIAHERDHQILARHPPLSQRMAGLSSASEEILASLVGAMVCPESKGPRDALRQGHCRIAGPRSDGGTGNSPTPGTLGPFGDPLMIGTKKLGTIRDEIRKALASGGVDPIQWLEKRIAAAKRKADSADVLQGLKQFLESAPEQQPRKRRITSKK
jgi:hypothetical protein